MDEKIFTCLNAWSMLEFVLYKSILIIIIKLQFSQIKNNIILKSFIFNYIIKFTSNVCRLIRYSINKKSLSKIIIVLLKFKSYFRPDFVFLFFDFKKNIKIYINYS